MLNPSQGHDTTTRDTNNKFDDKPPDSLIQLLNLDNSGIHLTNSVHNNLNVNDSNEFILAANKTIPVSKSNLNDINSAHNF